MTSPRASVDALSISSSSESNYSSTFLLGSTNILGEKGSSFFRTSTSSPSSFLSLGSLRRRVVYVTIAAICSGVLFANLCFNFAPSSRHHVTYQNFQDYLSERLRSHRTYNSIDNSLVTGSKPTVVALVSFKSQARTEILDCYLKQNLVQNGGLLDRVIFSPENATADTGLDWLSDVVGNTQGYNLLGDADSHDLDSYPELADKLIPLPDAQQISGSIGRSWKLAEALAQNLDTLSEPGRPEPLFLFINSETIYISPTTIASMIYTQQTQPEYSVVQANMVNQPVLSWLHNNLGVIKPYRPEGHFFFTKDEGQDGKEIFEELREFLDGDNTKRDLDSPSLWRASELPTWSLEIQEEAQRHDPNAPLLFGIPIDFQPPRQKHRWLPYDKRQGTEETNNLDFRHRPSLATPLSQHIFSLTGPGKWPWTLSAQALYSFLEHLEEQHDLTSPNTTTPLLHSGLSRYSLPLWTFSASPPLAPSFFLLSSSTLQTLAPSFPYHITPSRDDNIPEQENEEPTLAKWITSEQVVQMLGGRSAVVDGNAIAARFLPGRIGKSEWLDVDSEEVGRGLEGTDLLERFMGYANEVGCRAI